MKHMKQFFFLLAIFLVLLSILTGAILYLRPDIKPEDFLTDWKYWIVPVALMYIVFNFKNLLKSIFNRILLICIFVWSGSYFFPGVMNFVKPYVSSPLSSSSAKNTFNDLVTPKDGTKPVIHIDNNGLKYNPENREVKATDSNSNNNNSIDKSNVDYNSTSNSTIPNKQTIPPSFNGNIPNNLNNKNVSSLSNDQISQLSNQPLSYIGQMTSLAPPEVKERLSRIGINMDNPQQTISNLVGGDSKKQRQAINQIFK